MTCEFVSPCPEPAKAGLFRGFANTVRGIQKRILKALHQRSTRAELSKLDDYILKDMGISRSDIDWIVAERSDALALEEDTQGLVPDRFV